MTDAGAGSMFIPGNGAAAMHAPLDQRLQETLENRLGALPRRVRVLFVGQSTPPCSHCSEQQALLESVAAASDRISLERIDLVEDAARVRELDVDKIPATLLLDEDGRDTGIRFYGVTSGYEFDSLVEAIETVGTGESGLPEGILQLANAITRPTHLEVMVTLTCPYCPKMVRLAHQLAFVNPNIRADMVDAVEFPQLVQRYRVSGVPKTIVNGKPAFEGALPPRDALLEILKLADPEAWERIDRELRTLRGERKAHDAEPGHLYDLIIVGAGPAAMTATIYAARKALDVAVLGREVGGQIVNTETIENWPGIPAIGGQELATLFRNHAERFPVAERLGTEVTEVRRREDGDFEVRTRDGQRYRARSIVYCAGKQHRTLGVPGEARFLGRGIAFCATCDAPLYADRRVAVVGGGNSAFTAARDLLPWAREIHIINLLPDFQADPVLIEEVTANDKVKLHPSTHVRAFLGDDQLTGVRLESEDGRERQDLPVDGVFLEIGLVPNSKPVEKLLKLDEQGQIPTHCDGSTEVPGFFAAGDVTDIPDKQIVIAAGMGALAALAAARYLESLAAVPTPSPPSSLEREN
ncbi:MAG: hypothetical protein D6721_08200 [Gammaproteobacteria bacterium]|nr:MAG: hypothetical protein D6721_08200 [Gammaproteobacteria bacterium]